MPSVNSLHIGQNYKISFSETIQGLRALAVLLVIFYHAGYNWVPSGFIGVDVFFVISGYLISGILFDHFTQPAGKGFLIPFWARRATRLLPQVIAVVLVTMLLAVFFSPLSYISDIHKDGLSSLGYFANYRFSFSAQNYFNLDNPPSPFLHFWSLSVEEQFYIVFPVLLVLGTFFNVRFKRILWVLGGVALLSFFAAFAVGKTQQSATFFETQYRIWELAIGGLLAGLRPWLLKQKFQDWLLWVLKVTGFVMIIVSALVVPETQGFPVPWALLPVTGTVMVLVASEFSADLKILILSPSQWIGKISYSLYLWHWPILIFGVGFVTDILFQREVLLVLVFVVSASTYYLLENPIRRSKKLKKTPGRTLLGSIAALVLTAVLITFTLNFTSNRTTIDDAKLSELEAVKLDLPDNYADGCHLDNQSELSQVCEYGAPDAPVQFWLFGDSHAAQWLPAFQYAVETLTERTGQGFSVKSVTKSSCPSIDVSLWHIGYKAYYASCDEWRENVLEAVQTESKKRRIIVVISNDTDYDGWMWSKDEKRVLMTGEFDAAYEAGMARMVHRLKATDASLLVLGDTPKAYDGYWDCIVGGGRACDRTRADALKHTEIQERFAVAMKVDYFDLNDLFCSSSHCQLEINGKLIYRDSSHISANAIGNTGPKLVDNLVQILGDIIL